MIKKVAGPLVVASVPGCKKGDLVKVGMLKLGGEIIEIRGDLVSIQVYEETSGLKVGDPVENTGMPLSVELGPGLLSTMFDGIQRPLVELEKASGVFIARGVEVFSLNRTKKWEFTSVKKNGDEVSVGDIIGTVKETSLIVHKIMVPHGIHGKIEEIKSGEFTIEDVIAKIAGKEIKMYQKWPVRKSRGLKQKESVSIPLTTGQRIIDTMFPLAKGGSACVPGPFGAGKTVIQHQLAKWADADIIVFVGCGERGNEMTDVLQEFPELKDPRTGKPLLERTILIANTSNMPIAAREASIYTGAAIAEYFRDMGYNVALMADSTSRWAEALREMSGRLEEMPGEEGYPAYLSSRLADFYERSGYGKCFGMPERKGSLTIIGSVSPPGGDFSEPVVQNTLRVTKVFWGLDYALAHKRHFPAINWLQSYSLYVDNLSKYFKENIGEDFPAIREESLKLLTKEAELEEIVRLVGTEALSQQEQLILFICKLIREDFLYQSAFDPIDQFSSFKKQYCLLSLIINLYKNGLSLISEGLEAKEIQKIKTISKISKLKLIKEEEVEKETESIKQELKIKLENLRGRINNE
ncbi:V-type ATP synthase subunit A [candidate division WOR-1 bacterium RIFOXYA2_FULL_36_21]|uniref:V-type ATP synthase alpha chain n=1 Tax=candidate division WOR-1 bacterium RIFOXYB2_FULL_36_35 TaxID=1802578 RepID=A0A1F4RZZ6_UNCSA|nr:MAG: V-type ATP synthase subunit A [candidate division WOR-1 bacterium RIFOXYA2_FULL_36_21]OGC13741.1 MAG: V-type ATP synthase subunit A [candidate division WOR-1 bacterium RIFOXYB2_FULL_36_35]OGC16979.1 MAG: V-type ATP synthase subunit A [candidate division WOR-1 bacterium RIFOXYA12_FULL_36_13]